MATFKNLFVATGGLVLWSANKFKGTYRESYLRPDAYLAGGITWLVILIVYFIVSISTS
jgi:hypothetical protein